MSAKEVKASMGYLDRPMLPVCSNCVSFASDMVLPPWMVERNKSGEGVYFKENEQYALEKHGVEKNLRCSAGGFAVKKMGSCRQFAPKGGQ